MAGRLARGTMAAVLGSGAGGCTLDRGTPHSRLGALPFPGAFTFYSASETSELGAHHYTEWWGHPFDRPEGARGIMYTCRAGFIDLAHLREAVDWTRYAWRHTRALLDRGGGSHGFEHEGTRFELVVTPPAWWAELPEPERRALAEEVALQVGARVAYQIQTWHEIATWFGWRTVFLVPEDGSSFTWEDGVSNLLGVLIGQRLLREGEADYSRRAAEAIRVALQELGAVPDGSVDRAAAAVKGTWWREGVAVRRDLDTGLESGYKVPWLVGGLAECAGCEPVTLPVPAVHPTDGPGSAVLHELRITPPPSLMGRLPQQEPASKSLDAEKDYARLIDQVRSDMLQRWGALADRP